MEQPRTDLNAEAEENGGETMESLLAQQAATAEKLADRKVA